MDIVEAVREVYFWQNSNTGSFNNQLFDLMQKSDYINQKKIKVGFPVMFEAWQKWRIAEDYGNELFREYGLIK